MNLNPLYWYYELMKKSSNFGFKNRFVLRKLKDYALVIIDSEIKLITICIFGFYIINWYSTLLWVNIILGICFLDMILSYITTIYGNYKELKE